MSIDELKGFEDCECGERHAKGNPDPNHAPAWLETERRRLTAKLAEVEVERDDWRTVAEERDRHQPTWDRLAAVAEKLLDNQDAIDKREREACSATTKRDANEDEARRLTHGLLVDFFGHTGCPWKYSESGHATTCDKVATILLTYGKRAVDADAERYREPLRRAVQAAADECQKAFVADRERDAAVAKLAEVERERDRLKAFAEAVREEHECILECFGGEHASAETCPCGGDECWRCAAAQALYPPPWSRETATPGADNMSEPLSDKGLMDWELEAMRERPMLADVQRLLAEVDRLNAWVAIVERERDGYRDMMKQWEAAGAAAIAEVGRLKAILVEAALARDRQRERAEGAEQRMRVAEEGVVAEALRAAKEYVAARPVPLIPEDDATVLKAVGEAIRAEYYDDSNRTLILPPFERFARAAIRAINKLRTP